MMLANTLYDVCCHPTDTLYNRRLQNTGIFSRKRRESRGTTVKSVSLQKKTIHKEDDPEFITWHLIY